MYKNDKHPIVYPHIKKHPIVYSYTLFPLPFLIYLMYENGKCPVVFLYTCSYTQIPLRLNILMG